MKQEYVQGLILAMLLFGCVLVAAHVLMRAGKSGWVLGSALGLGTVALALGAGGLWSQAWFGPILMAIAVVFFAPVALGAALGALSGWWARRRPPARR